MSRAPGSPYATCATCSIPFDYDVMKDVWKHVQHHVPPVQLYDFCSRGCMEVWETERALDRDPAAPETHRSKLTRLSIARDDERRRYE